MSPTDLWMITLGAAVVVVLVVAVLLEMIVRTAGDIDAGVATIWVAGKRLAANTATILLLQRTRFLAGALLESAGKIATSSERIRRATEKNP